MARGNRREAIFLDDDDRRYFLKALGEAYAMTGWRVHASVLMGNHCHLLIEMPKANLGDGCATAQHRCSCCRKHVHAAFQRSASAVGPTLWESLPGSGKFGATESGAARIGATCKSGAPTLRLRCPLGEQAAGF